MDFEEFQFERGKNQAVPVIRDSCEKNEACSLHETFPDNYCIFIGIGGMPQLVNEFIFYQQETGNIPYYCRIFHCNSLCYIVHNDSCFMESVVFVIAQFLLKCKIIGAFARGNIIGSIFQG